MSYGNSIQRTTPVVLNLIIINALVFFAQAMLGRGQEFSRIDELFALHHYRSEFFKPHQIITSIFMHAGFFHLLFNMLALWMFGSMMEKVWGSKRFLIFYMICGLGASLAQLGDYAFSFRNVDPSILNRATLEMHYRATVGASGAIMGVLAAFGYLFPNTTMFIMPIPFPVKAKWAILGIIALDVFGGISRVPGDNIAHFAHLGGAVIGFLIVFFWNRNNKQTFY